MRTSPGAAYDLGYHLVWCPKYRRPVLDGRVKTRLEALIRAKADEHGWQIVATVGAVSAETVQRYIQTQYEGGPKGGCA